MGGSVDCCRVAVMKRGEQQRDKKGRGMMGDESILSTVYIKSTGNDDFHFPQFCLVLFFEDVRGLLENRGKIAFGGCRRISPIVSLLYHRDLCGLFFFLKIAGQSLDFVWN